jgi:glycosyltransferase involved in cell wall biosynthesis
MSSTSSGITALVHTKNAAATLADCLESLKFVDHVLVIDMDSTDETRAVAKKYKATVYSHPDVGYVEPARNFALQKVKTPWTLIIDADEEVPKELQKRLLAITKSAQETDGSAEVVYIPRKNIIFDRWIKHTGWWPDYQLRFFKTGMVDWPAQIHAQPEITGEVTYIEDNEELALIHHNYQSVEQFIDRLNRYTTIEVDRGQHATKSKNAKVHVSSSLSSAFASEFSRRYFVEHGSEDGVHGLALSYLQSFYQLVVQLKKWQAAGFPTEQDRKAPTEGLEQLIYDLEYWLADYHAQHSRGLAQIWWKLKRKFRW